MQEVTGEPSTPQYSDPFAFYEFFAGGGMARLGLGSNWNCLFSNDVDAKKVAAYRQNFADAHELHHGDIGEVNISQLPGQATLAWASFPCQDLSLAGNGKGLAGDRSGVFWAFWKLMQDLGDEGRRPPIIALENVSGLVTSHGGQDLTRLLLSLKAEGYRFGALHVDAALFVAQSRPRLFLVAVSENIAIPENLTSIIANPCWHPASLQLLVESLEPTIRDNWIWWKLPMPSENAPHLSEVIEAEPKGVAWHSQDQTDHILSLMTDGHRNKIAAAQKAGGTHVGTIYRRTRAGQQRAEVRFDGVSGCLRTPAGGSSRQIVMIVQGDLVRTRLISPRETARLMGLPESYILPSRYNDTYHLTGDGVVVPAVAWLEQHILRPLAAVSRK